jgi:geranylgeranyl diphosphate synthase type II
MIIKDYFAVKAKIIEASLDKWLPSGDSQVGQAMRYAVMAGGKRIRPVLAIATSEMLGGKEEDVLPGGCALEFIHNYSLIHDDLPCMDNDDFRRGRPTTHKQFGETTAILAGNTLIIEAFRLLGEFARESSLPDSAKLKIITEIAQASGMQGMIAGQVSDLESEKLDIDADRMAYIHSHKTGALIRAAVLAGAYASNATDIQVEHLHHYAEKLGLMFQVTDDILDIEGSEENRGKKIGGDIELGKATYPRIHGMDKAKALVKELMEGCRHDLASFGDKAETLIAISDYVGTRKA